MAIPRRRHAMCPVELDIPFIQGMSDKYREISPNCIAVVKDGRVGPTQER